jgi:RNA polymerase sigma-70 factor (ECF subfamily)
VTTRLALDRLKSAQVKREAYVGPWLPEPILTSPDIADDVALADSVSLAMLVVLETLSPLERAVFVLREAFAFSYAEIGETLDRSEEAVRQLAKRARQHVQERRPRYDADQKTQRRVTEGFLSATLTGDLGALMELLAPDVVLHADGGGVVRAARRVIHGADKVGRFMIGAHTHAPPDVRAYLAMVNGQRSLVVTSGGEPFGVVALDVLDGKISAIRFVVNPEKLRAVRPIEQVGTPIDFD